MPLFGELNNEQTPTLRQNIVFSIKKKYSFVQVGIWTVLLNVFPVMGWLCLKSVLFRTTEECFGGSMIWILPAPICLPDHTVKFETET